MTAESLEPHLSRCGYPLALLAREYNFGPGQVPLATFAHTPHDARSVCIAAINAPYAPGAAVAATRSLGSPVVFVCHADRLQWWKQTTGAPELVEPPIEPNRIQRFFDEHKKTFSPSTIFEGKTLRRLPGQQQLRFVDVGLMPFVERTEGERLSRLVEAAFRDIKRELRRELRSEADVHNAIKATFWLLAAKALRDKSVEGFKTVDLADINAVFSRVGRHYGVPDGVPPPGRAWHAATSSAAERIASFDSLRNLSTEALAHVYENALVTPEVRRANGTHSTPGPLVDYMVWQLWPLIESLPQGQRHIFEPACGHAAFLVAALRMLRQWSNIADSSERHDYLKRHLHGIERDSFALEVARLSLTLADIPHGNKWDLRSADMFLGTVLEEGASACGVLLANPPYQKFAGAERAAYLRTGARLDANTKACEMLRRTLPYLMPGSCFGVVVPQGLLHSREGAQLRRTILSDFDLCEIDTFEDRLFEKGDHEAAVLMGQKTGTAASGRLWFRRVRNPDIEAFRERFAFSSEELVDVSRFVASESADLRVPEVDGIWSYLRANPTLDSLASVGQGLIHHGRDLPRGEWTIHDPPRKGDSLGFDAVPDDLKIAELPDLVGINLAKAAIRRPLAGFPTDKPQVIVNYAPVSRKAWRLKACLDVGGHALTSDFLAVRPRQQEVSALYLWTLMNSPVANAFAYCTLGKRHNIAGTMRNMPMPYWSTAHAGQIEQAAMRYRTLATSPGPLYDAAATPEGIKQALLQMDAAVLRAYDLPPQLERQLLDLFTGVERKGVGCTFAGYYPPGFTSFLPLHLILSERFQRAAADATVSRFEPGQSNHIRAVLAAVADEE